MTFKFEGDDGTFAERLNKVLKFGNLSVTDLSLWFDVKRGSIHQWLKGVTPALGKRHSLGDSLYKLESLFHNGCLPIPLSVSRGEHRSYITELKNHGATPVSKARTPAKRRKTVVGKKR